MRCCNRCGFLWNGWSNRGGRNFARDHLLTAHDKLRSPLPCSASFFTYPHATLRLSDSKVIVDALSEAGCNAERTGKIDVGALLSQPKCV
jgi:hypothetical protein